MPRSGKAADFVYRMSLFEEPEVELSGKRIVVQGASAVGFHQADATSLEISDAALSTAIILGENYNKRNNKHFHVICDDETIPLVFLKLTDHTAIDPTSPLSAKSQRKNEDGDLRPYKASFVRAALMVMSARKEAQLQVRHQLKFFSKISFSCVSTISPLLVLSFWFSEKCYKIEN